MFVKSVKMSKDIKDLQIIRLDPFRDHRGQIWTLYSEDLLDYSFVSDKISVSRFGVLRGCLL